MKRFLVTVTMTTLIGIPTLSGTAFAGGHSQETGAGSVNAGGHSGPAGSRGGSNTTVSTPGTDYESFQGGGSNLSFQGGGRCSSNRGLVGNAPEDALCFFGQGG
jgi:hypothetical protein